MTASAPRSLAEVRAELRKLLEEMELLYPQTGLSFQKAYLVAKSRADKLALEYAELLNADG